MADLELTDAQVVMFQQVVAQFLNSPAFIKSYFGKTGAEKKAFQISVLDQKIAATQAQIDNIDTIMAGIKAQKLAELQATISMISDFKAVWELTPE